MEDKYEIPWTQSEIDEFKYESVNHKDWQESTIKNEDFWTKDELRDFIS